MADFPRRWGAYVLIRPLGGGGMGDVFLALHGRAGKERLCVVKRLIPGRRPDLERVERFRREAEIVRTLAHGTIAQTIAIDELDGEPYIVQEFIDGRNLSQLGSAARSIGGAMPYLLAVHIVREVARALAYAHRVGDGIVHRDVAPDNIMVTFSGEVRLIDFGLARGGADPSLTKPGVVVGRYSYTAPEVLAGGPADRRADIYSLGVVLWQLLTGRDPTFAELDVPPVPSSIKGTLPIELDAVVSRALAADPVERYGTAEQLQRALGPFLPSTFLGEQALADFVGRCYEVDLERRRLRDECDEARPLLFDAAAQETGGRRSRSRRRIVSAGAVAAGAALLAVAFLAVAGSRTRRQAHEVVTSPTQAAPAAIGLTAAREPEVPSWRPPELPAIPPPRETVVARRSARALAPARRETETTAPGLLLDRARDNMLTGDLAAAERDARDALRAGTTIQRARAHVIVGQVLVLRGQNTAAADEFTDALQLDPSNEAAAAALAHIRRQRGPR